MKGLLVFVIIFILVIGIIGFLIYNYYEKPMSAVQNTTITCNLSVATIDSGNLVETNYYINTFLDGLRLGRSSSTSYIREYVIANSSVLLFNSNIDNQDYYTNYKTISFCAADNILREDLDLIKYGVANVSYYLDNNTNEITINITSSGLLRSPAICIKIPPAIISIDPTKEMNEISVPERLKYPGVSSCYDLAADIQDSSRSYTFSFSRFGTILPQEYIEFYLIDRDYRFVNGTMNLVYEEDSKDVGLEDVVMKVIN